ncbi:MFS transporter [Gordonia sp. L191]|uniref:MFS transporter n=1 Tax=Gordonia sp. L191 TaxID=2982699 RepID=UPI0024C0AF35|nr:MFS transporter [Gordonia sp. L191]WHU48450.1 MFS transporter [Gordonia sp. L191]
MASTTSSPTSRLSRVIVLLFAVTAGSSAGCLYYLQPVLHEVGGDLHVSTTAAGLIISVTQVGYLIGLALVVPLGDFLDRRRLVGGLLVVSCIGLAIAAAAPTYAVLIIMVFAVGVSASAAQVVVPWAAAVAGPSERGAVVGTVMSGLLVGILFSRVLSGLIAQAGGWRTVLVVAAVMQVMMAAAVWWRAPHTAVERSGTTSYPRVLASIATLIRSESVLRHRMVLGGLNMAAFSAMWTAIAFLLAGAHGSSYHFSDAEIGLFGLAGVAGALAAPRVGRLADRGYLRHTQYGVWVVQLLSWGLLWAGAHQVLVLILALLVFDFGVQGVQIANQAAVYSLDGEARSRLTTAYMVAYFAGGVAGSAFGGWAYQTGGWNLVCAAGAATAVLGIVLWAAFAIGEREHSVQGIAAQQRLRGEVQAV